MNIVTVFYAGQVYATCPHNLLHKLINSDNPEIYNGCYLHMRTIGGSWFRGNRTPVLLADVPKELLVMELLLGL